MDGLQKTEWPFYYDRLYAVCLPDYRHNTTIQFDSIHFKNPYTWRHHPGSTISLFISSNTIRLLLLSSLGLSTTELGGRGILLGLLRAAEGADTGDSDLAQVGTVSALSSVAGNALVDPKMAVLVSNCRHDTMCQNISPSNCQSSEAKGDAYLRLEVLGP
jgi:hypothetical protein